MKKKINVAVLGLGVGERHLNTLIKSKNVSKIKVFDLDSKKKKFISEKYAVLSYKKIDEVFFDNEIDLIVDATYDNYHYQNVSRAINCGKHIFVEKPAFQKFKEAKKCFGLLKNNKKIYIGTNYILRSSPRFKMVEKMIRNKFFGDIYHFEGDYNYGRLSKITRGWRGKIPYYSVTLGGGSHIVDLALFLINKKILEVKSYANKIVTKNSNFRFYDNVISIIKFEKNITGKISSNFSCVYPHFHKLSVYGSKKTFENFNDYGKIYLKRNNIKNKKIFLKYKPKNKGEVLENFIQSILTKKNRLKYITQIFDTMSVCFAIEKSLNLNKKISVKYIK